MSIPTDQTELRDVIREKYAAAAIVATGENASAATCCNAEGAIVTEEQREYFGSSLYEPSARDELPEAAVLASLGCGNPIAVAELHEGETVLDLGSGGGIDVLLSARRVGPTGLAYGLDMTDEMLDTSPAATRPRPASPTCNGCAGTSKRSRYHVTAWTWSSPTV